MSLFICPVCKSGLIEQNKSLICKNGHCFDFSKEGYVNLLLANQMNSKEPGDSKLMAVSRSRFLEKEYYASLLDSMCNVICEYVPKNTFSFLDCGCGEGYYTNRIYEYLISHGKKIEAAAFDISKPSVSHAAKHKTGTEYAVASVFDIPVNDQSFDVLLNIFSPMSPKEYYRVLKNDGIYIYVVPGSRHLWQMKEAIYDTPYENAEEDIEYPGFVHIGKKQVRYTANIENKEDIKALFSMTPYYWKTSAKGTEKLLSLDTLMTEISFDIHIYRKQEG